MYDFKPGDKVQIDPALVNGGARKSKGIGVVMAARDAGTQTFVCWPSTEHARTPTRDLVPVADTREAAR